MSPGSNDHSHIALQMKKKEFILNIFDYLFYIM